MCVIMYKPSGKQLPSDDIIKKCWDRNSDGAGLMVREPHTGKMWFEKGFMKYQEYLDTVKELGEVTDLDVALHFRITSKGETSPEMTHPFQIRNSEVQDEEGKQVMHSDENIPLLMHNGTISSLGDKEKSDTYKFASEVLPNVKNLMDYSLELICDAFSSVSKFLIFSPEGIAKVGKWVEKEGIFYSNDFWDVKKSTYYPPAKTYGKRSNYYDGYSSTNKPTGKFADEVAKGGYRRFKTEVTNFKVKNGANHYNANSYYPYYVRPSDLIVFSTWGTRIGTLTDIQLFSGASAYFPVQGISVNAYLEEYGA